MSSRANPGLMILVLTLSGFGCAKKADDPAPRPAASTLPGPAKCGSDGDCAAGLLCESKACVPADLAQEVRAARRAKAENAVAVAPAPSTEPPVSPIPEIPTELSPPPQGTEWKQGVEVNTQQSNSQPDKCTLRVLREWVQVTCREDYSSYEAMENFGTKGRDYFASVQPNKVVDFVFRLRKGKAQSVKICGEKAQATLFVNWPAEKDRPTHIALGKGARCEGDKDGEEEKDTKGKK
jgi:hypothetical protein